MRILSIILSHFPLNCEIKRRPDIAKHAAVVLQPQDSSGSQKLVLDYSPGLSDLHRDMPLQQVLSRHGEVEIIQADWPYYWSVFNEILEALELKSPMVEGADLGVVYIGLDGMQLIYPKDDVLIREIQEAIAGSFPVQIGISEGKFPAYMAALHSVPGGYRILNGDVAAFLKDFPCELLPISIRSKEKLQSFGIGTIGQIVALPVGPLQSQFGFEGRLISNLARGYDDTPLYPRFMAENIEESTLLSSVTVSLETILITMEALLSRVFARDCLNGRGIRSITLWTRGWLSEYWEHSIQYKEPAMEVKSVVSRAKTFLERHPQPGPVERVGLKITGLGYRSGRQRSLFAEIRAREHLIDDIKQLETRLGGPQVFKIKEIEPWSRIPERRYVLAPLSR